MNYENQNEEASLYIENNEQQSFDFDTHLDALRHMVRLNPIAYAKEQKARKQAEKLRDLYIKYEPNDIIGVDYSIANNLEYVLRKQALERLVEKTWRNYVAIENDDYGLSQYADDCIKHFIENQKQKKSR